MAKHKSVSDPKHIPGAGRTPEPARVSGVKVRATQVGYYDHARRREGDVFVIDGETYAEDVPLLNGKGEVVGVRYPKGTVKAFSETWMERVDAATPEHTTAAPDALKKAQHAITGERSTGDASVLD